MRKTLGDLTRRPEERKVAITSPQLDKQGHIKRNQSRSVNRSPEVQSAVLEWLLSFDGGMTTKSFEAQIIRLDADDDKAMQQLQMSRGKRILSNPPRIKPPKLETDIIQALAQNSAIAIEAASGRKRIEKFISNCPEIGTYILDMNELASEYIDYSNRGKAGQIIHDSKRAEVLIILGLDRPISLAYHIRDTLYQIVALRLKDGNKYTLSTWNYTHDWYMPEVKDLLIHYS